MASVKIPNFPNHEIPLKNGCPYMSLVNLNSQANVQNGTRFRLISHTQCQLTGRILTGPMAGQVIHIPRIRQTTKDEDGLTCQIVRLQFPVVLAFCITIDKSQGQTFQNYGIYLPRPLFAHGQLYVALSRIGDPRHVCIWMDIVPGLQTTNHTRNIVFQEVFNLRFLTRVQQSFRQIPNNAHCSICTGEIRSISDLFVPQFSCSCKIRTVHSGSCNDIYCRENIQQLCSACTDSIQPHIHQCVICLNPIINAGEAASILGGCDCSEQPPIHFDCLNHWFQTPGRNRTCLFCRAGPYQLELRNSFRPNTRPVCAI